MMKTSYTYIDSPVGRLLLTTDGAALTRLYFADPEETMGEREGWMRDETAGVLPEAIAQLQAYFAGERRDFDLPMAPTGTPFQRRVWDELCHIPYGATISYGELARRLGDAKASRAVGLANGRNPIAIIVPCHRVIGANGTLTGYGGGLDRKRTLLSMESSVIQKTGSAAATPAQPALF